VRGLIPRHHWNSPKIIGGRDHSLALRFLIWEILCVCCQTHKPFILRVLFAINPKLCGSRCLNEETCSIRDLSWLIFHFRSLFALFFWNLVPS
jgi:hypothetical protein